MEKKIESWKRVHYIRTGKCDFKKCGATCCRFKVLELSGSITKDRKKYEYGFGKRVFLRDYEGAKKTDCVIQEIPCRHLDQKTNRCRIQKTKSKICKNFPHISDTTYQYVKDKCGYKFKKI